MKKLFLLSICAGLSMGVFAQSSSIVVPFNSSAHTPHLYTSSKSAHRITSVVDSGEVMYNGIDTTDVPYLWTIAQDTTAPAYAADSGYFLGMSAYGFTEFAQRYDFNSADSTVEVIGVVGIFGGTVNPASTNSVIFTVWSMGAQTTDPYSVDGTYSGLPNSVIDTITVMNTALNTTTGDAVVEMFTSPSPSYLSSSFFVGYTMNYTWGSTNGDTVSVLATNFRNQAIIDSVVSGDSIINDQNAVYSPAPGVGWMDNGYDWELSTEYFIFPIINANVTAGIKGVTKNDLTFFGNYPNPASDQTNIKFSLANNTDVTITIMDMSGHTINTLNESNLAAGMNIIPVNTSAMASGNYLYLVRTASGAGMAGKMTIVQ